MAEVCVIAWLVVGAACVEFYISDYDSRDDVCCCRNLVSQVFTMLVNKIQTVVGFH